MVSIVPPTIATITSRGFTAGAIEEAIVGTRTYGYSADWLCVLSEGQRRYDLCMCRNIRTLYNFEPPADDEEVRAAALQYVRKISGFAKPSQANAVAFERAVDAVAAASAQLLDELVTSAPPKDREVETVKARARAAQRFAA